MPGPSRILPPATMLQPPMSQALRAWALRALSSRHHMCGARWKPLWGMPRNQFGSLPRGKVVAASFHGIRAVQLRFRGTLGRSIVCTSRFKQPYAPRLARGGSFDLHRRRNTLTSVEKKLTKHDLDT